MKSDLGMIPGSGVQRYLEFVGHGFAVTAWYKVAIAIMETLSSKD